MSINFIKSDIKISHIPSVDQTEISSTSAGVSIGTPTIRERVTVANLTIPQMELMYKVNAWIRAVIDRSVTRIVDPSMIKIHHQN